MSAGRLVQKSPMSPQRGALKTPSTTHPGKITVFSQLAESGLGATTALKVQATGTSAIFAPQTHLPLLNQIKPRPVRGCAAPDRCRSLRGGVPAAIPQRNRPVAHKNPDVWVRRVPKGAFEPAAGALGRMLRQGHNPDRGGALRAGREPCQGGHEGGIPHVEGFARIRPMPLQTTT